jgi:hypothetical protein
MKLRLRFFIVGLAFLWTAPTFLAQNQPIPVSLVQLIATAEKFDGKMVTVRGYLESVGARHDISAHLLYLSREDAENRLDNAVAVVASEQMRRDEEKINHMYVTLTGMSRTVRTSNGSSASTIKDVQSCTVWSDPKRPIGEPGDTQ